jgi:5-formyltetrahydrofolate cyclo-ligase
MQTKIREAKAVLRKQVKTQSKVMSTEGRAEGSARARTLLEQQVVWNQARSVLFFAPMAEELDVWPLAIKALAQGKAVALPRYVAEDNAYIACLVKDLTRDVQTGYFGIREPADRCAPVSSNRLDLILVPGVAFDLQGRRLGRGKGFYDQLLAVVLGTRCGVAFDEQIVPEIPVEPHDMILDCLLTPTRWVEV